MSSGENNLPTSQMNQNTKKFGFYNSQQGVFYSFDDL